MGITGLWDILGDGEIWHIAEYAAEHFKQHKRPLRIAVDEACWRFTNVTPEQVQKIREGEPASNPVEKVILWRILRLLKLNVQLIFVNDGPKRPWKRGRRGGRLDYELIRLTRQLLDQLKVPHHRAPAEAEAECAKLQALGIVDAVWSDDGDSFMFGCGTLIRQHKDKDHRMKDHVRVYHAESFRQKLDLDTDSLVLFALLSGGDYNVQGLRGCGPINAARVARISNGLARAVCHASQGVLPAWRQELQENLKAHSVKIDVPWTFPDWKALCHYRNPVVSTDEELCNLRGLMHGWDRPMNEAKLRVILRERFNFSTREYVKHIIPIFLSRALARAGPEQRQGNSMLDIQFKRTRRKKGEGDDAPTRLERKITFSPVRLSGIDLSQRPPEEDWTKFAGKDGAPYDATQNVECEVLECFLRHGLPDGEFDKLAEITKPAKRKREAKDDAFEFSSPARKHQSTSKAARESSHKTTGAYLESDFVTNGALERTAVKQKGRLRENARSDAPAAKVLQRDTKEGTSPSRPASKNLTSTMPSSTVVVDLCSDDSDIDTPNANANANLSFPIPVLSPELRRQTPPLRTYPTPASLVPGQSISAETLRGLRAGSALLASLPQTHRARSTGVGRSLREADVEVIDLS